VEILLLNSSIANTIPFRAYSLNISILQMLLRSFLLSFFLIEKKQKIKAEKITSLCCQAAMFNSCTTVASTFDLYS